MLDELVKQALVGTSRTAPTLPNADGPLGEALRALDGEPAEAKLLGAAAILSRYESCGRMPTRDDQAVAPAVEDARPACSRRAGEILALILSMTNTPAKQSLLGEWLALATAAKQRVPHRLLPALFEHASYRPLRQSIADAADARGAWLMALNPRWQFAVGEQMDHRAMWETGTAEQRASAIRRLREIEPAGARELIASTWKQDGADERMRFVEAMRTGLSMDDEPFLESALDDRSKQVRSAAAELLARLPESTFVKRMIDRADPLLKLELGVPRGIFRKGKLSTIEVTLPPESLDPSWARDGIAEKPAGGMGQRQWRLVQLLSSIPPAHWSEMWDEEPQVCLVAAAASEHADALLRAWTAAVARHPDRRWSIALTRAALNDEKQRPIPVDLLRALPVADRLALVVEAMGSPKIELHVVAQWVGSADFAFDRRAASAVFEKIEKHLSKANAGYDYHVANLLEHLALRVPPAFHDELAARWRGGAWEQNRTTLDKFFATLALRRDLQREFTT